VHSDLGQDQAAADGQKPVPTIRAWEAILGVRGHSAPPVTGTLTHQGWRRSGGAEQRAPGVSNANGANSIFAPISEYTQTKRGPDARVVLTFVGNLS
jgi:hypothetical protein